MATQEDIRRVEHYIGYPFKDRDYLKQALTAAGADEDNHDGNRKLAQLGKTVTELALTFIGYETTGDRGKHNILLQVLTNRIHQQLEKPFQQ
jgi:dsRNA-specific ribonuclease